MCQRPHREKKKRERRHASLYQFCRKVKGQSYQARLWFNDLGSINLGLYRSEWQAGQVVKEFIRRFTPGADLCDVLASMRRDGIVPQHVLAKYVELTPGEPTFIATVRKCGKLFLLGPFPTEKEAHIAMVKYVASLTLARDSVPTQGPRSPYLGYSRAATQLGVTKSVFLQEWATVFTNPIVCRRVILKDEVEVAVQAGGGTCPTAAKEAVVIFRMGCGRLDRHPVGREFEQCRGDSAARGAFAESA